MINCKVEDDISFECGGHNNKGCQFIIKNCVMNGYVDFFDVWFGGDVQIIDNFFKSGTNMLRYVAKPYGVSKKASLEIRGNTFVIA